MMTIVLIAIMAVTVVLVVFLAVNHKRNSNQPQNETATTVRNPDISCCGAHEICEAETLLTLNDNIIYYSDEELDAYRGIGPDDYTQQQIDEFRDVLLTLRMYEVTGWLKSLQLRRIEAPSPIRDEALMIVEEFRKTRQENRQKQTTES